MTKGKSRKSEKMELYSKITKKFYGEDEKALLLKEEAEVKEAQKKADVEKRAESAKKKELASKIDKAELALEKAYEYELSAKNKAADILDKTQMEAAKIISKGNEEAKALLDEAKKNIREAQKARYEALNEFNENYGTYTKTITGEDAKKEYEQVEKFLDDLFGYIFK